MAFQEIAWKVKPRLVVETGVAHGGSLVFWASMLELLWGRETSSNGAKVIGIDIEIRQHNRRVLEAHPLYYRLSLIEGSSTDDEVVCQVTAAATGVEPVIVVIDSNHTHEHVLSELRQYMGLVTPGSYLIVMDTVIEYLPKELHADRPWGPGNSPVSAVAEFLAGNPDFQVDAEIDRQLMISAAPGGYLRKQPL
jgi:cephalosporin hydroxylase